MRRPLAVVAVLAALLAGCGVQDDATPAASPPTLPRPVVQPGRGRPGPSGLIVFTSPREEREQLHAVMASGFGKHPLARVESVDVADPAFSPDGALLTWLGARDGRVSVWVSANDGTLAEELPGTDGGACPSWAGDARSVLYLTGRGSADARLRVATLDGADGTVAVPFPASQLGCGAFLPGERVVVERELGPSQAELWTFTVGSDDPDRLVAAPGCRAGDPVPSPDGAFVGFTTSCEDPDDDGLWFVPATGGVPAVIVRGPVGPFSWAPDGRWMVYTWGDAGGAGEAGGGAELRVVDVDGSDVETLVDAPSGWPTWSPPPSGGVVAP